jgi:hypothetical protein
MARYSEREGCVGSSVTDDSLQRRFHETDDNDTRSSPPTRGRSPSSLRPAKRTLASNIHGRVINTEGPMPWKKSPTIVLQPGKCHGPSKPNPFRNHSKEIRPTVANISSDLPRRKLFQSDWNLDRLKETRRKSESSLPFKVDSKGKPLVPVALGSRQRMTSKS